MKPYQATFFDLELPVVNAPEIEMRHFSAFGRRLQNCRIKDRVLVGYLADGTEERVARSVAYDKNGSQHKCNAACQHATGHDCECSCGGANHGSARMAGTIMLF